MVISNLDPLELIDDKLTFDVENHRYYYAGVPCESVTSLVARYTPPFDENAKAADKARKLRVSRTEVLADWRAVRERAAMLGTMTHEEAERIAWQLTSIGTWYPVGALAESDGWLDYNTELFGYPRGVWRFFDENKWVRDAEFLLPELRIAWPEKQIAGTIDLLVCTRDGNVTLLDWKTSRRIDPIGWGSMLAPIEHVSDGNFWKYALQLSFYAEMVERRCSMGVDTLLVVHLGRDGRYRIHSVPRLSEEVSSLVASPA